MGFRIESLRVYLENLLGDIPFLAAYKHLVVRVLSVNTVDRTFQLKMTQLMMNLKASSVLRR
jgi:hypothetical protein